MHSLELNVHQLILSEFASVAARSNDEASYAQDLILPKVGRGQDPETSMQESSGEPRIFMVQLLRHSSIITKS